MPNTCHYSLFDSPIGRCGIAWNQLGVCCLQLPESSAAATRKRILNRFPDATQLPPSKAVSQAISAIVAVLSGRRNSLEKIPIDMTAVPPFFRRVYEAARQIPAATTCSYGEIARLAGSPNAARAVGQALRKNPFAIVVPCHRVIAAQGKWGGFSAAGGISTKQRLLALESSSSLR